MWIVGDGNPVDGYDFYGPFALADIALEFAGDITGEYFIAELTDPGEFQFPLVHQSELDF